MHAFGQLHCLKKESRAEDFATIEIRSAALTRSREVEPQVAIMKWFALSRTLKAITALPRAPEPLSTHVGRCLQHRACLDGRH